MGVTATLDRPFGMQLWPHLSNAFELFADYPADDFAFVVGKTPMSTMKEASFFVAIYYTTVFGGRELMRNRAPLKLKRLFLVHNLFLTAISAALLALYIEEIVPTLARKGVFYAICDPNGGWTQHLVLLYYLTYLTKYFELLDTVFLVLKKKPITLLHCYHHGATAVLCYIQLTGNTTVSWVPITLNLAVHVVMYWYYFQGARGVRIWWKEWVTRLQIIQFIIDLGFVYFASYTCITWMYFPAMPSMGKCAGGELAAATGVFVLSSYLVLFISFYSTTYKKAGKPTGAAKTLQRMSKNEAPGICITHDVNAKAHDVKQITSCLVERKERELSRQASWDAGLMLAGSDHRKLGFY